jgi:hypothetical protein
MNTAPKVFAGPRDRTDEVSERKLAELYEQVGRLQPALRPPHLLIILL